MATLYVMQGVPGSGKSTLASKIRSSLCLDSQQSVICSTDNYFHDAHGNYIFKPEKLGEYHAMNLQNACSNLKVGHDVIVDNTNLLRKHVKPYVEFAHSLNIPVVFIRVTGNFKSIHGVPNSVIERMKNQMEDLSLENVLTS